ncbi:MAG TPA: hypothetical protein VI198_03915 [Candidatus Eisenbacteria bacterium]
MKIQPLLLVSAILLMCLGVVTLFAPDEIAGLLSKSGVATRGVVVQLLAGALFALGILDWMNRYATIGGIYGRPVVLANFAFFFITATTLARHAPAAGGIAFWGATGVCGILAALYALLFFGSARGGTA